MLKNNKFNKVTIWSVTLIITLLLATSYIITHNQIDSIKQKQYLEFSNNITSSMNIMIKNKQQLTTFIALAFSQNRIIIQSLNKNDNSLIDIEYLSNEISKKSSYKHLWYQILDKNGNSFYRSWTKKSGDSLLKARPEISKMIKKPQTLSAISIGKFAMTFKSMVPIFDQNHNFIGIFEVISHFDSISDKLLENENMQSIFLADKKYKNQITKPFTKQFIDDYYVTSIHPQEKIVELLKENGVEHYIDIENKYAIHEDCNYLIVTYPILDINNTTLGYTLLFKTISEIKTLKATYIQNNAAALIFVLVLLTVLIGYYLINKRHSEELIQNTKFQTIGEMAAGITHEINTPLTYIKGRLEISKFDIEEIKDPQIKQNLQENYEIMYSGTNRIAMIIESMKAMSQSSLSAKKKFNVYTTLIVVLRILYNRSKQITPIYINNELFTLETSDINKETYFANINAPRMEQVWTIILNNALDELQKIEKYEDRRIDINLKIVENKLKVDFIDNAGGVPHKILPQIFEPFVSTKESSGIGIGLNVAKKIIKEHKSEITVTNTPTGACFTVILDAIEE